MLLTCGNPKTDKGVAYGWHTAVLHLSPSDTSGRNVCPWASKGCIASCLNTAGRGGIASTFDADGMPINAVQAARKRRTQEFFSDRQAFISRLAREIDAHERRAHRAGLQCAVRLNGTSDLPWEKLAHGLIARFSSVQFYDYTKSTERARQWMLGYLPANYHLTFSRSESNGAAAAALNDLGVGVAAVYSAERYAEVLTLPNVVDGDKHDLRFLDPRGALVALKAKGRAKRDTSGFVVR